MASLDKAHLGRVLKRSVTILIFSRAGDTEDPAAVIEKVFWIAHKTSGCSANSKPYNNPQKIVSEIQNRTHQ